MIRALVWKEWREQRPLVLAGVAATLVLPLFVLMASLGAFRGDSIAQQVLPALTIMVLLPMFAAATGATCFADDRSDDTLAFLLSRPASRGRIWTVKVGVALMAFLAIAVLMIGASSAIGALADGPTIEQLDAMRSYRPGMRPLGGGGTRTFIIRAITDASGPNLLVSFLAFMMTGPGFLMVLFGASVFWSTRLKRPLNAMFAGVLTAIGLVAVQIPLLFQGNGFRIFPPWPLMATIALLLASFLTFETTEPAKT